MGRLTHGLSLQYLQRWASVAQLSQEARDKLQRMFMENQNVPHIRALASYPMQLAILLHLLQRRQLLPQRRTELFSEYLKTFLDREQTEDKEPLLAEERQIVEDIHAYIGWYIQAQAEEGKSSGSITRDDLKQLLHQHLEGRQDGQKLADRLFSAFTTRVLCLVERDPGSFQFEVQSLREYFAAVHIFDEVDRSSRDQCLIALRLNQATFSARTLWLLLPRASEATAAKIVPRLADTFEDLLAAGIGDLRELALMVGNRRTIKFGTFRGHRASLPVGGWASDVKIGALRSSLAEKVLQEPHQWPGDLTQRAVEAVETRLLEGLAPLGRVRRNI